MQEKKNSDGKYNINEFSQKIRHITLWQDAWRRLAKNKMSIVSLVIVGIYTIIAIAAPILPIYSYKQQVLDHQYLPPSFSKTAGELFYEKKKNEFERMAEKEKRQLSEKEVQTLEAIKTDITVNPVHKRHYWLGTDSLGRDMLARIIYGGQISISIGLVGALLSILIGTVVGAISGYIGGKIDSFLMRFVDVMYGLPYMLIVIILMALLNAGGGKSNGVNNIIILFVALALISWLTVARVIRGQVISLKQSEFVEAARSIGASNRMIIFRHLVPNTIGLIIVFTAIRIPSFIMTEAFLSFLGLGISAPYASWGSLIGDGVTGMELYPWRLVFPSIIMIIFLFAMNFIGDGLRDALDPQSKNKL